MEIFLKENLQAMRISIQNKNSLGLTGAKGLDGISYWM
jgi:hypothetical protein